jgi:hypothetical protein
MDQGARRPSPEGERALLRAKLALEKFLSLAGAAPTFARRRALAEKRLRAIRDMTECDFHTPEAVREEREMELRRQAAEEELRIE